MPGDVVRFLQSEISRLETAFLLDGLLPGVAKPRRAIWSKAKHAEIGWSAPATAPPF
jgi:hypothetical protein